MNVARIAAAGLLAWGAWELYRRARDGYELLAFDGMTVSETVSDFVESIMPTWSNTRIPEKYRSAVIAAEVNHGLPDGMLGRLLYQESRYRDDIITGQTKSPAGAVGIAQFMPATAREMGINPLDPYQAIDAAARYLAKLYRATGSWDKALASYNWGIGNVTRKGLDRAPTETRNYFTQILADLGLGGANA